MSVGLRAVRTSSAITLDWQLDGDHDPAWRLSRVLYAYVVPGGEIAYIGKAGRLTVRRRWSRAAKADFWQDLERERRMYRHAVLVGYIDLSGGARLTDQLLSDIETLLIVEIRPWGNIQACASRICRPVCM